MRQRRKTATAAGERALSLVVALGLACAEQPEPEPEPESESAVAPDEHAAARERLAAYEQARREATDFATLPASDGRFGADPYRLLALPDGRVAGLLRGADRLVLLGAGGEVLDAIATPHDPTDLVRRDDELLVVGTGDPAIARYGLGEGLESRAALELPGAAAGLRTLAIGPRGSLWVLDEAGQLYGLRRGELAPTLTRADHCRGPLALEVSEDQLLSNCLIDHSIRIDRILVDRNELTELATITHDGPIWSFALGPETPAGRLLALTGVEDHPLDRSDGGFGYIDSFVFLYTLDPEPERRAAINVSELGVVTPKWSRWLADDPPTLELAGYATADLLRLRFAADLAAPPQIERRPGLPGTTAAITLADGATLASSTLLDAWLRLDEDGVTPIPAVGSDDRSLDDRSWDERLGELLVFTTAMAPWNPATEHRSRFTCETCHFEGRGDGRVHFTGREREGMRVHATSKMLFGLFSNRPYFSRALDRTMAGMVDNEFRVANHHGGRDPWFSLTSAELPWLAAIPGWPGEVDGEDLRRALMAFFMRYTPPGNPAVRGRAGYRSLEREGAELFASLCEGCHQARLVTDDPATRIAPAGWERLIFSENGPIVWAREDYVATEVEPHVHSRGARVPSLRRLVLDGPYFTNGSAASLAGVLAQVRRNSSGVTHGAGAIPAAEQLSEDEQAALLAFLRLL